MADKNQGPIIVGTTAYSTNIVLRSAADGTEISGKAAADLTAYYWRQGGTPTAIVLSNLAAIGSVFSSGGVKEAEATNMKGTYRLDIPDSAWLVGADWVEVDVSCAGSYVFKKEFALATKGASEVFTLATTINGIVGSLPSAAAITTAVWAAGARTLTSFGTLVSDVVSGVWGAATRSLTSIGNIISGVLDEPIAGHVAGGSVGSKINSAAAAGDPLSNPVPGTYAAGEAGFVLGSLGGDHALIVGIDAKTQQIQITGGLVQATGGADAASIAAAVWAKVVETQGAITAQEALSISLAILAGVTTSQGFVFKTPNGLAVRVTMVVDADDERTSVILTPSA